MTHAFYNGDIIVSGDFNVDLLNPSISISDFLNLLKQFNMDPQIEQLKTLAFFFE